LKEERARLVNHPPEIRAVPWSFEVNGSWHWSVRQYYRITDEKGDCVLRMVPTRTGEKPCIIPKRKIRKAKKEGLVFGRPKKPVLTHAQIIKRIERKLIVRVLGDIQEEGKE